MYCSVCGKSLENHLNYCNGCGARIRDSALMVGNSSMRPFMIAAMLIGGGGLFGFVPLLKELLRSSLDQAAIVFLLVAYLVAVFAMFSVLVGHIWKRSGDIRIKGADRGADSLTGGESAGLNTARLPEYREPVMSVTDHTTKTLDQLPLKRN